MCQERKSGHKGRPIESTGSMKGPVRLFYRNIFPFLTSSGRNKQLRWTAKRENDDKLPQEKLKASVEIKKPGIRGENILESPLILKPTRIDGSDH